MLDRIHSLEKENKDLKSQVSSKSNGPATTAISAHHCKIEIDFKGEIQKWDRNYDQVLVKGVGNLRELTLIQKG